MGPKISLPMGVKEDMERLRHELRKDIEMYGKPETEIGNIRWRLSTLSWTSDSKKTRRRLVLAKLRVRSKDKNCVAVGLDKMS